MLKSKVMPACGNTDCAVSSGICGALTFGSGELDDNGYWKNPCVLCALAWKSWDDGTDDVVWPDPPPLLTFKQMIRVLEGPMGIIKKGTDPFVADERRKINTSYKKLRTTRENKATDKAILADIGQCMLKASSTWLAQQFDYRAIREASD